MPHAIRIHQPGGPEVMKWELVELPPLGKGQILVRHTAVGVNYIDTYHRSGLYPLPSMPSGIGQEGAGVVEEIGEGVSDFSPGDRVIYTGLGPGSYSEKRVVPADKLVKIPSAVSDETAAASFLKGMTVEYLIHRTHPVRAGQTVLWHAAAGGVGLIACQWLRHKGVTVIGTVSSEEKARLAAENGCTHPIIYTRENFVARVKEITGGKGVPVVFDSVGKTTFEGSLDCLAPRGLFVSFGNASGKPPLVDPMVLSAKGSLFFTRPTLHTYTHTREELLDVSSSLFSALAGGIVAVKISGNMRSGMPQKPTERWRAAPRRDH